MGMAPSRIKFANKALKPVQTTRRWRSEVKTILPGALIHDRPAPRTISDTYASW